MNKDKERRKMRSLEAKEKERLATKERVRRFRLRKKQGQTVTSPVTKLPETVIVESKPLPSKRSRTPLEEWLFSDIDEPHFLGR